MSKPKKYSDNEELGFSNIQLIYDNGVLLGRAPDGYYVKFGNDTIILHDDNIKKFGININKIPTNNTQVRSSNLNAPLKLVSKNYNKEYDLGSLDEVSVSAPRGKVNYFKENQSRFNFSPDILNDLEGPVNDKYNEIINNISKQGVPFDQAKKEADELMKQYFDNLLKYSEDELIDLMLDDRISYLYPRVQNAALDLPINLVKMSNLEVPLAYYWNSALKNNGKDTSDSDAYERAVRVRAFRNELKAKKSTVERIDQNAKNIYNSAVFGGALTNFAKPVASEAMNLIGNAVLNYQPAAQDAMKEKFDLKLDTKLYDEVINRLYNKGLYSKWTPEETPEELFNSMLNNTLKAGGRIEYFKKGKKIKKITHFRGLATDNGFLV